MRLLRSLSIVVVALALGLGCASTGLPVEPYLYAPPNLFAGSDTNVSVLIAQGDAAAGVRLLPASETSVHVLGPVTASGGKVLVNRRKPEKVNLILDRGSPLPSWTRHLFTETEARGLSVTFADNALAPPTAFRQGPDAPSVTVYDPGWTDALRELEAIDPDVAAEANRRDLRLTIFTGAPAGPPLSAQ